MEKLLNDEIKDDMGDACSTRNRAETVKELMTWVCKGQWPIAVRAHEALVCDLKTVTSDFFDILFSKIFHSQYNLLIAYTAHVITYVTVQSRMKRGVEGPWPRVQFSNLS